MSESEPLVVLVQGGYTPLVDIRDILKQAGIESRIGPPPPTPEPTEADPRLLCLAVRESDLERAREAMEHSFTGHLSDEEREAALGMVDLDADSRTCPACGTTYDAGPERCPECGLFLGG